MSVGIPSYSEMDRLAALSLYLSSMWRGDENAFRLHVMTGLGKHFGITGGTWQNLADSYCLQPGHHSVRRRKDWIYSQTFCSAHCVWTGWGTCVRAAKRGDRSACSFPPALLWAALGARCLPRRAGDRAHSSFTQCLPGRV